MPHDLLGVRHRSLLVTLLLAPLLMLPGCGETNLRDGEILHPTPENDPPEDASVITTDTIPAGLTPDALSCWRQARDHLLGARMSLGIGSESDGPELFGMIGDANFDTEGNILVLDALNRELRVFAPDGAYVGQFARAGEGPITRCRRT